MDVLSAQEIRKRIRQSFCKEVSLAAIHNMAKKLGYSIKRAGGKRGYHKSLYTDLQRHWSELLAYDAEKVVKTSQRPSNMPNMGNYYTYNGETDRKDYDWEVDESLIREALNKSISLLFEEQRALQMNIFGGVDDMTDKYKKDAEKKRRQKVAAERRKEKKERERIRRWREVHDNDSKRMVGGGLFGDEI